MDLIKEIHGYLAQEMNQLNSRIISSLATEEKLIELVGKHLESRGGKRIRPILCILSSKIFQDNQDNAINLSASIELLHMATLLHDDVVDQSMIRRFLPSANSIWGNKTSILVGDFLFSQAFKLMVSTNLIDALVILSDVSAIIAEGEVMQLTKLDQQRILSQKEYFDIINAKTAELFAAAAQMGPIINNQEQAIQPMKNFGIKLGLMFQISDDLLDYLGKSDKIGKNIGDDFFAGTITLPIILLYQKLSEAQKTKLDNIISQKQKSEKDLLWITDLIYQYNIHSDIVESLEQIKQEAILLIDSIDNITNEQAKNYLLKLLDFAIDRCRKL